MNSEDIRGWRPSCLLCRRPVGLINAFRDERTIETVVDMRCHGNRETMRLHPSEWRRLNGGIREMIEIIGPFRKDAAEYREREYRGSQMWRDMLDQEGMIRATFIPRQENYIPKKPKLFIADEIDSELQYKLPPDLERDVDKLQKEMTRKMYESGGLPEEVVNSMSSAETKPTWNDMLIRYAQQNPKMPKEAKPKPQKPKPVLHVEVEHTRVIRFD